MTDLLVPAGAFVAIWVVALIALRGAYNAGFRKGMRAMLPPQDAVDAWRRAREAARR